VLAPYTRLLRAVDQSPRLNSLLIATIDVEWTNAASEVCAVNGTNIGVDRLLAAWFVEELQEAGIRSTSSDTDSGIGSIEANACAVDLEEGAADSLIAGTAGEI